MVEKGSIALSRIERQLRREFKRSVTDYSSKAKASDVLELIVARLPGDIRIYVHMERNHLPPGILGKGNATALIKARKDYPRYASPQTLSS
jgi:hypothetical protein